MRKCIVTIPAIERYMGINAEGEFQKEVFKQAETHNAFFHRWVDEQYKVPVYRNGSRQYSPVFALVEYEDGTVHRVKPEHIKFVER